MGKKKSDRPMAAIKLCETKRTAAGFGVNVTDGDVIFEGQIAADVTPARLAEMLDQGGARIAKVEAGDTESDRPLASITICETRRVNQRASRSLVAGRGDRFAYSSDNFPRS